MNKKKMLSAVTLLTIATVSAIGARNVYAVEGNIKNSEKNVYISFEKEEDTLTSEKLKSLLEKKNFKLITELTGNVKTGTKITVEKDGVSYDYIVVLLGDIDKDGAMKSSDVTFLRDYVFDPIVIDSEQIKAADVDRNGKIDSTDISILRDMLMGECVALIPDEELPDSKKDFAKQSLTELAKYADTEVTAENVEAITAAVEATKAAVSEVEGATDLEGYDNIAKIEAKIEAYNKSIEENPEEIALAKTKAEAIKTLSELYQQKNYFENDWETIDAIISAFKSDLDALDTETKVETFLEETKIELNKIETRQAQLTTIINDAKNNLDTLQSEYTAVDYDEDKLNVIATIITNAKGKLDNLDKDTAVEADVTKIVNDATDEITLVKTKLDVKKEEAKADLDKYLVDNNINNENYNSDKLEQIVGLVNDGKMLIDKVSKTSDMNTALSDVSRTRDEIIDEIKAVPNKLKDLEDLKTAEIAEITNAIANDNYTDEQKLAIAGIKEDAISKIKEITDPELTEKVKEISNTALSELSKFRTPAQNAAIDAINAKYIKEKYYSEDWDKMVKEINKTKSEIEKALDSEIQSKLDALYAKLDGTEGYKTIEEQLLAKKTEAKDDLKAKYFGNTNKKKYDTQTWSELQVEYNNQIQIINQQKTKTQVDLAWENALSVLGAYKTIAQNTEIVKNEALAELDKALTEYTNSENYSDDSLKALQDIVNAAKTKINKKGAKISAINAAKEEAITNMKAVPTIAQEALAACKEEAIKAIKSEYINNYANLINKEHAYEDAQVRILAPMYTPDNAINALTTIEEVNAKKDEMINTMKAQPKAAELRLTRILKSYVANDYYNDDWANINKAFEDSIKVIQESYKIAEINSAEETATNYISNNNIKTKDQVRQDTISAALAEISTKYAQYQDNQDIQGKINEIMSKANTDMTNAKTTYGVDGVLAIKDKAIKDIDDYIAGLQLPQE